MNTEILKIVEGDSLKKQPDIKIGDTIKLYMKIKEGSKERIQLFQGIVIALKGSGINRMVTVRKISLGVGVEKIVPLHAPTLDRIEIVKRGKVRRSKLYFMRDRIGKSAMRISGSKEYFSKDEAEIESADMPAETAAVEVPTEMAADASGAENTKSAE